MPRSKYANESLTRDTSLSWVYSSRTSEDVLHSTVRVLVVLMMSATSSLVQAQVSAPQRFENTTAGISLTRPAGWHTASLQTVQENRERVQDIHSVQVSSLPAAHMRARYTMKVGGSGFPVLTRLWLVPRGQFMFLIGMSGPPDGPDLSEAEFAEVLGSISIQK